MIDTIVPQGLELARPASKQLRHPRDSPDDGLGQARSSNSSSEKIKEGKKMYPSSHIRTRAQSAGDCGAPAVAVPARGDRAELGDKV